MAQNDKRTEKADRFVIGAERYERISAVEGIVMKPSMKTRLSEAQKRNASAAAYRKSIVDAHRKA